MALCLICPEPGDWGDESPPLDVAHHSSCGRVGLSAATSCALPWSLDRGSHPSPASGRHGAQGSGSGKPTRPPEERGTLSWACWGRPCRFEGNNSHDEITCGIMRNYAKCHRAAVSELVVCLRLDSGGAGCREHSICAYGRSRADTWSWLLLWRMICCAAVVGRIVDGRCVGRTRHTPRRFKGVWAADEAACCHCLYTLLPGRKEKRGL
mmetsp:Transcript_22982/g.49635  ORF Transcript_22982/g.49635 Transcript_22982/m.49635 type:complete len:209 (+) Transcript_22982:374-1000(+)